MFRPCHERSLTLFCTPLPLHKIGYVTDDKFSFCKSEPETCCSLFCFVFVFIFVFLTVLFNSIIAPQS